MLLTIVEQSSTFFWRKELIHEFLLIFLKHTVIVAISKPYTLTMYMDTSQNKIKTLLYYHLSRHLKTSKISLANRVISSCKTIRRSRNLMAKIFHSTSQRAAASQPNINGRHYPATQTFYFHLTANIFRQTACKCQRFVSWIQRKSRDPSFATSNNNRTCLSIAIVQSQKPTVSLEWWTSSYRFNGSLNIV